MSSDVLKPVIIMVDINIIITIIIIAIEDVRSIAFFPPRKGLLKFQECF